MTQIEVEISIGGRSFDVACQEGEEHYLIAAARLLDGEAQVLVVENKRDTAGGRDDRRDRVSTCREHESSQEHCQDGGYLHAFLLCLTQRITPPV